MQYAETAMTQIPTKNKSDQQIDQIASAWKSRHKFQDFNAATYAVIAIVRLFNPHDH